MKLKFKKIYDQESRPILAQFENGILNENSYENIITNVLDDTLENGNRHVVAATDSTLYDGVVNADLQSSLYNTFIGVRNKLTNQVKLYAVDTVNLSLYKKIKTSDEEVVVDKTERTLKINRMNKEFGSKRVVRNAEAREKVKVNVEAIKDHLEKTIQETSVNEINTAIQKPEELSTAFSYLPPINRNATLAEKVYNLYDLISMEEIESLKNQAKNTLASDFENINCCSYVAEEIAKLQSTSCSLSEEVKLQRCCVWLYIDRLISFLLDDAKKITRKQYSACDYSSQINKKILDTFAINGPNGRNRPLIMRDKCLCYILVLTILTSISNIVDIETLSTALRTSMIKLKQNCQAVGAKSIGTGGSKDLYSIRLPLPVLRSVNNIRKSSSKRK